MKKLEYSRFNTKIKNEFIAVPYVVVFFLSLTAFIRFPVEFCVVKFSSFG